MVVYFFKSYGNHRDLHVLTHSFPSRRSSDLQDVPLYTFSATFLAEIESLLNTQHEDRYLFAGSQTNTRAVDLSDAAYTPQAGLPGTFTADLDYYQGDTLQLSVRSAETFETTYGITADEPAFEELLRALAYMGYAGTNQDEAIGRAHV